MLVVLDYNKPPPLTDIDAQVKGAAELAYASERTAVLILMPVKYAGQKQSSHISACRRIEDAALANSLNIDHEIMVTFKCDTRHGNDRRPACRRARLCVFEKYVDMTPWFENKAANNFFVMQAILPIYHALQCSFSLGRMWVTSSVTSPIFLCGAVHSFEP